MDNFNSKMPSSDSVLQTATEKPQHYSYLKEFRTQQCPLFLQHKCTQHRPFTCFHWHFLNQRRRRPLRKRDGTFNYSPDVYCTKYDETTGLCPDGEECPLLHRTAGDTERRYHLRYYKTGTCVHETDSKGHCVKNGPHCAFAHGAMDLRPPVYDVREIQSIQAADKGDTTITLQPSSLEKERMLNEDPKWNDTNYVLAMYKTDQCKKPPRLCRQGYACPHYHNPRDRRRSPKKLKYRSTPCPNVKHGDEWGDPSQCENGDNCPYCHSRTEQQFHPEIYKSTKCNDMVQTGYCPRGPFCAFAHVEQEMTLQREMGGSVDNSLAAFVSNALPDSGQENGTLTSLHTLESKENKDDLGIMRNRHNSYSSNGSLNWSPATSIPGLNNGIFNSIGLNTSTNQLPEPIGKGRSNSVSSTLSDGSTGAYMRAPGSEREDPQIKLKLQIQAIDNDPNLDTAEKNTRKQNLVMMMFNRSSTSSLGTSLASTPPTPSSSAMSPHAVSFYPAGDTVESVIGNALDDLSLDLDFDLSSIEKELEKDEENSLSSSYSAGISSGYFTGSSSVPMNIPVNNVQHGNLGSMSMSQSPPSPFGSYPTNFITPQLSTSQQKQEIDSTAAAAFINQTNVSKLLPAFPEITNSTSMSPRTVNSQSQCIMSSPYSGGDTTAELQRLREELRQKNLKIASWEEGVQQARSACEAWKKEVEECSKKVKLSEDEKMRAFKQRDEAIGQVNKMKKDYENIANNPFIRLLQRSNDLEVLPIGHLKTLQQQLKTDIDRVDRAIFQYSNMKCLVCHDRSRTVAVLPCNHVVFCEACSSRRKDCPYCNNQIGQRTSLQQF